MLSKWLEFDQKLNLLIIVCLSLSLSLPVIEALGYDGPGFFGALLFALFVTAVYFLFTKFPILFISIPVIIILTVILNYFIFPGFFEMIFSVLTTPQPTDSLLWPLATISALSLFFHVMVFRIKKPLVPFIIIGLVSFIPLWYIYIDVAYPAAAAYIIGFMVLVSYKSGSTMWSGLKAVETSNDSVRELRQSWLLYTVFVLVLALAVSVTLPKNISPLSPAPLRAWARETFPFIGNLRGMSEESMRGDGSEFRFNYGETEAVARLGGPLRLDGTILLEVRGRGGFHLRGTSYDHYSGVSWLNTSEAGVLEQFAEPSPAMSQFLTETEFWVRYNMLSTNTIFSALYPEEILGLPGVIWSDENDNLTQSRSLPVGLQYQFKGNAVSSWGNISDLETDDNLDHKVSFLQLPDHLPHRVIDLAIEVSGDLEGNYEKIRALERFLREGYEYNINVPLLPPDADFVDYFLFELEEGYCTSFASALVVMSRAVGVPTRYVVGFMVPNEPSGRGVYQVAGLNAHAWVEGYIPGVGWLTFEPTPGFATGDFTDHEAGVDRSETDIISIENGDDIAAITSDRDEREHPVNLGLVAVILLVLAISAFAIAVFKRNSAIKMKLKQIKSLPPGHRAVSYYILIIALLEGMSAGKYPGETPVEFSQRVKHDHLYHMKMNFKDISEGVSNTIYSNNKQGTQELAEQTELFFHYIYNLYKLEVGRWNAFIELLVFGKHILH